MVDEFSKTKADRHTTFNFFPRGKLLNVQKVFIVD